jgi:hypothetical protein
MRNMDSISVIHGMLILGLCVFGLNQRARFDSKRNIIRMDMISAFVMSTVSSVSSVGKDVIHYWMNVCYFV